jgi:hypothetical protein
MTDDRLPLADLLTKAGDGASLRSVAEALLQMLNGGRCGGPDRCRAARAHRQAVELP